MLIDELVKICDNRYSTNICECGNMFCSHPSGTCSGDCSRCLYEIHFPGRNGIVEKKTYDCPKMMDKYVCQYLYSYASEILTAFYYEYDFLRDMDNFRLLSIACGACPDLMALEKLCIDNRLDKPIAFRGYDINKNWNLIHSYIKRYCDNVGIQRSFFSKDVLNCFHESTSERANIITISYLISYLYNTNQNDLIISFFEDLTKNVIMKKANGERVLVIINDVNSNRRGREYFDFLTRTLKRNGARIKSEFKYFDTGNLNFFQKVGSPYKSNECLFDIPINLKTKHNIYDIHNRQTIQLLVEVY